MILSTNIKKVRDKLGLNQSQFAELLGLKTHVAVSLWESGKTLPDADMIVKIAEAGQVTLDWLMRNEDKVRVYISPETSKSKKKQEYISIDKAEKNNVLNIIEYKLLANVPAGNSEVRDYQSNDYDDLYFDPRAHFYLQIDDEYGYSMAPFLQPGDRVLINSNAKVKSGDLVAARWDKTKGAIKIYGEVEGKPDLLVLNSYNAAEAPIVLTRKEVTVYKIVLIKKKK